MPKDPLMFGFVEVFWFIIGMDSWPMRQVPDLAAIVESFGVFSQDFGVCGKLSHCDRFLNFSQDFLGCT